MLSFLASVLTSVALVLGLIHTTPKFQEDYTQLRQAAYSIEGSAAGMFGVSKVSCSGVLIQDNMLLTAAHCAIMSEPSVNGKPAKFLKVDEKRDIALMYVEAKCPCVPVGEGGRVGDELVTVGYPYGSSLGYVQILTQGVVQGFASSVDVPDIQGYMVVSIPVEPGNSGGGVFLKTKDGWRVVSVVSRASTHLGIFPSNQMLKEFLNG